MLSSAGTSPLLNNLETVLGKSKQNPYCASCLENKSYVIITPSFRSTRTISGIPSLLANTTMPLRCSWLHSLVATTRQSCPKILSSPIHENGASGLNGSVGDSIMVSSNWEESV